MEQVAKETFCDYVFYVPYWIIIYKNLEMNMESGPFSIFVFKGRLQIQMFFFILFWFVYIPFYLVIASIVLISGYIT